MPAEPATAEQVKEVLRRRYPANGQVTGPGPWTTLEEYAAIDLLAFAAWQSPTPKVTGIAHPIVGHEIKVSRSDYRRELLRPSKRALSVARCHAFYFVTPKGLLSDEEKAYVEPEHFSDGSAFVREPCPERCRRRDRYWPGAGNKTGRSERVPVALGEAASWLEPRRGYPVRQREDGTWAPDYEAETVEEVEHAPEQQPHYRGAHFSQWLVCGTCEGRGYMRRSVVEEEAPTLWVPRDVGLIEVTDRCRVVRKAPVNHEPKGRWAIGDIVRWASYRPDPRHLERHGAR